MRPVNLRLNVCVLLYLLAAPCGAFYARPVLGETNLTGGSGAAAPRLPFAFVVSGGGFRTMTGGMAFARALSRAFDEVGGSWEDITHVAGGVASSTPPRPCLDPWLDKPGSTRLDPASTLPQPQSILSA